MPKLHSTILFLHFYLNISSFTDFYYNGSRYVTTLKFSTESVSAFMVICIITKLITLPSGTKDFSRRQKVNSGEANPNSDHLQDHTKTIFPPIGYEIEKRLFCRDSGGYPDYDLPRQNTM